MTGRGDPMSEEYEHIAQSLIFWRAALIRQRTPENIAFALAQIARLEARLAEENDDDE